MTREQWYKVLKGMLIAAAGAAIAYFASWTGTIENAQWGPFLGALAAVLVNLFKVWIAGDSSTTPTNPQDNFFKLILLAVMLSLNSFCLADTDKPNFLEPPEPDVPAIAKSEAMRRGNMVQEIGTINAGPVDLIADALAVPEDDSHKWYLTLITMEGCAPCARLKNDFQTNEHLRQWVNINDPKNSYMHFHIVRREDETQRDWLRNIKDKLTSFPIVVIQPPANGQYGKPATIVAMLYGYDGNAERLTQKMRAAIVGYVEKLQLRGESKHIGENAFRVASVDAGLIADRNDGKGIGAPPPFPVPSPDNSPPFQPLQPQPLQPQNIPPFVDAMTMEDILKACPQADAEFLRLCAQRKPKNLQELEILWREHQNSKNPLSPLLPPQQNGNATYWLLGAIAVAVIWILWKQKQKQEELQKRLAELD